MKPSSFLRIVLVALLMMAAGTSLRAQRFALTSNLLEDALVTPNVGVEVVVADQQSLSFDLSCAPYKLSQDYYNQCMTFRAGYKYWFNQALYAHHLSIDAVATSSDFGFGKFASQYEYLSLGIGYGYSFIINQRINLVPSVGIGIAYGNRYEGYDHMNDAGAGVEALTKRGLRPFVTRLALTIQYVLN